MGIFDKSQETTTKPYKPVREPLDALIGRISGLGADPWEVYGGEEIAGFSPAQIQALQEMGAFGGPGGKGAQATEAISGAGETLLGGFQGGLDLLERGADRDPVEATRADLGYAADIADNPFMDDMIQSALRDVTRSFSEGAMPGIAAGAAQRGHLGSSRRGAYEAISERGHMDRAGDIAAGLRGGAYETGLGMAEGAAGRQTAADLSFRGEELDRAGGMLGAGGMGADLTMAGFDMGRMNIEDLMRSGSIEQAQEQAIINSLKGKHYLGQTLPYDQAGAEMNLLMGPGTAFGTTTQESSANPIGAGLGIAAQLGGAYLTGGASLAAGGMFGGAQSPAPAAGGGGATPFSSPGFSSIGMPPPMDYGMSSTPAWMDMFNKPPSMATGRAYGG